MSAINPFELEYVEPAVRSFLGSQWARSYRDGGLDDHFILKFREVRDQDGWRLICTTWGYDLEELPLPTCYEDLVRLWYRAQLGTIPTEPAVARKLYYEMLRRVNDAA